MGAAQQHDLSPADGAQRGNQTSVHRWLNTNGTYLVSTAQYFDTGTVQTATDPKSNSTTFAYSATYEGAYPTTVTNALTQSTTHTYDFNTGLLTTTTDPNNQPTSFTYDNMWRLHTVTYPDTGSATITHQETTFPFTATLTKTINTLQNYVMTNVFDGVGRVSQSQLTSDTPSTRYTVTTYDALGRKSTVYNPTRCSPPTTNCGESTWGYTTYGYDGLGRVTKVTQPDGSILQTSYTGSSTTVTDEALKKRTSVTDGLGRLKTVFEDPSGLNYETDYLYDALDDLTNVTQSGSRQRIFGYDSLSRLTTASNPESGTIGYTYDGDGNVLTRKDARSITTTYSYDALNRLTEKSYSDSTPAAYFIYDTKVDWNVTQANVIGRMTEAYTYPGGTLAASIFSYDPVGRTVTENQCDPNASACPPGTGFAVSYTYDLAGDPLTESNGFSTNSYQYNSAMQPTMVTSSYVDANHPATLASGVTYSPPGQISKMTYGNGLTGTYAYNNRLQPCRYDTNSSGSALGLCTDSTPSGSILDLTNTYNWGSNDNGNVASMSATGQQTFGRSYTYDQVNRLATMSAPGDSCSGLSWGYDQWGNRKAQTTTSGSCVNSQLTFTAANQISNPGFSYDASGNLTHDASHSYFYDAENRIIQVDGTSGACLTATACYFYDAFGRRDARGDAAGQYYYLYDLDGDVVSEWDIVPGDNTWGAFYVYIQGRLLTLYQNSTVYFAHSDHLGSTRLLTTLTKTIYDSMDYLPFGEQIAGDTGTTHKFTGKERDNESGLDNFGARYYSSTLGRWNSPDWSSVPAPVPYANLTNPQTLNLYAMVRDNPESFADLDGHDCCLEWALAGGGTIAGDTEAGAVTGAAFGPEGALIGAGLGLGIGIVANGGGRSPAGYVPGGSLTDENGNSVFQMSKQGSNAQETQSAPAGQSTPAQPPDGTNGLQKPPTGKGSTPPEERDPKRTWTKEQRQQKLDQQNGKCAQCGEDKTVDETNGHHKDRHADGGPTNNANHAEVCKDCHKELHKRRQPN
jgi:RHS repeat-associated protein